MFSPRHSSSHDERALKSPPCPPHPDCAAHDGVSPHARVSLVAIWALACTAAMAVATPAAAQFGNEWVSFEKSPSSLSAGTISSASFETDLAWGDLDLDGHTDLVVVRKQPYTSPGRRTNLLLMNEGGVLTDRTTEFASAADVPGDNGFLTPTNDRDVVIGDVNGDGWPDVITATTLSDGLPKHIGHPRIYINLCNDGFGDWLGLEFQAARTPQLFSFVNAQPHNPRFCSVAAGDVNGDGALDLYFGDTDMLQLPGNDLDDRLLINDGNGFFSDQSQASMTSQMLDSTFAAAVGMGDFNGDGTLDIIRANGVIAPLAVSISYNNLGSSGNDGIFNDFDDSGLGSGAPLHVGVGDLNNDGLLDVITSDENSDRYRFNVGNDISGRAEFSSSFAYTFLSGGDDGNASNNLIVDLDNDGWADTLHADIDVNIGGGNRRLHIYHNLGGESGASPGDHITLREERESAGPGWIGVKGMLDADLSGTHDVAVFDINGDGLNDMVVSRESGTDVWLNTNGTVIFDGFTHAPLGDATLTLDPGVELRVGNLGSSGEDGFTTDLAAGVVGVRMDFDDLDFEESDEGSGLAAYSQVEIGGNEVPGSFATVEVVGGELRIRADFTALGATSVKAQFYSADGVPLGSNTSPGPISVYEPPKCLPEFEIEVCEVGFIAGGDGLIFWEVCWVDQVCEEELSVTFEPIGGSTPDTLVDFEVRGTDLADFDVTDVGVQLGDAFVSGIGDVRLIPTPTDLAVVGGSSVGEGIEFSTPPNPGAWLDAAGEVELSFVHSLDQAPVGGGIEIEAFGIGDEEAGNVRMSLEKRKRVKLADGKCKWVYCPAAFAPGPTTLEVYNQGLLVATFPALSGDDASFTVPDGTLVGPTTLSVTNDPQFMEIIRLPAVTTIEVGLTSVSGDEVRTIPDTLTQTLIGFTSLEVTNIAIPVITFTDTTVAPLPWTTLTGKLAGALGAPDLIGSGPLTGDSSNALLVVEGVPSSPAVIVVGFSQLVAPFKSGVLVPNPDLLISLSTDASGSLTLPFTMPSGLPAGVPFYTQVWITDASVPAGFSATNGLEGVTP